MSQALTEIFLAAVKNGDIETVRRLLPQADLRATDGEGNTAIHLAAKYNHNADIVNALLKTNPSLAHVARSNACLTDGHCRTCVEPGGEQPLHMVGYNVTEGAADIAKALLAAGADINARDNGNHTVLHILARLHSMDNEGMHEGEKASDFYKRQADLIRAHSAKNAAVCKVLLEARPKPDLHARDSHGHMPLHHAALFSNIAFIKLLRAHGANPYSVAEDAKPADFAVSTEGPGRYNPHIAKEIREALKVRGVTSMVRSAAHFIKAATYQHHEDTPGRGV